MNKETMQNHERAKTSRPLIVSYSYSGNTHQIAQGIQRITGGDWCEIHPWQPYPMSFPELLWQVKREIKSQYRPRLLPVRYTPNRYSIIFVGSPNWRRLWLLGYIKMIYPRKWFSRSVPTVEGFRVIFIGMLQGSARRRMFGSR